MSKSLLILGVASALILLLLPEATPEEEQLVEITEKDLIQPETLAKWIITGDQGYTLLDVRSEDAFRRNGIKTAVPAGSLDISLIRSLSEHRRVIVYATSTAGAVAAWKKISSFREDVFILDGGLAVWDARILHPRAPMDRASEQAWADYHKNIAVADYLLGKTTDTLPVERDRVVQPMLRPRGPLPVDEGC